MGRRALLGAWLLGAVLALPLATGARVSAATASVTPCPAAAPGHATCLARVLASAGRTLHPRVAGAVTPFAGPSGGLDPTQVRSAYGLPSGPPAGAVPTVAIVDAFHYAAISGSGVTSGPGPVDDLAVYRAEYGLAPCTVAGGCFRKVAGSGTALPTTTAESQLWDVEGDLDVDAVSAVCPACHILFVEAQSDSLDDLMAGVSTAVALGATEVSLSFGGSEFVGQTDYDGDLYHPGVAITAATGDSGYGTSYPASSPYVTAVGGTTLTAASDGGWSETAWNGGGSGCSALEPKPAWQHDPLCTGRTEADVAAVADPATGLDVFNAGAWQVVGGTSLSTPVVAGMYALGGGEGAAVGALPFYLAPSVHDIVAGANGSGCTPALLCTAAAGFDGPTGLGSPNGPPAPVPPSQAAASPASLGFGSLAVGSRGAVRTATLTNSGATDVHVSGVGLGGADPGDFALTGDTCTGGAVAAGASCSVGVAFAPSSPGPSSASLAFTDDATASPQSVALTGNAVGATNASYIHSAYLAMLGHDADAASFSSWLSRLNAGTPRATLAMALATSAEYRGDVIGGAGAVLGFYRQYLGRASDAGGVAYWIGRMAQGTTFEQVRLAFAGSPEYFAHHHDDAGETVDALYNDVLGRAPDPAGRAYWVTHFDAATIAAQILYSSEGRSRLVGGYYQAYLGRAADPAGLAYWTQAILGGASDEQILAFVLSSDEFFAAH